MADPRKKALDATIERMARTMLRHVEETGGNDGGAVVVFEPGSSEVLIQFAVYDLLKGGAMDDPVAARQQVEDDITRARAAGRRAFRTTWTDPEHIVEALNEVGTEGSSVSEILSPPPPGYVWLVVLEGTADGLTAWFTGLPWEHTGLPWEPQAEPRPAQVGRNDPCPCGSGKKNKKCCLS